MAPTGRNKKDQSSDNQPPRTSGTGHHLLLDSREVPIVEKLDPQVQENWRLQRSVRKSLLGYAILDLVKQTTNLVFGTWNSRPLKATHINRLHKSFKQEGLERFEEKSVIPVVIQKNFVAISSLTQDLSDVKKIPLFKFSVGTDEGSTPIKCAGGRHRFEALQRYLQDVRQENEAVVAKRKQICELPELAEGDIQYFNHDSIKELQHLGGILQYGGQWLVAVYDEATLLAEGIELAQYLSRNETRHVYMETDEERVIMEIQLLATLPEEKRAQRLKELRARNSSKRANPLVTVVNSESAFKATELLVNRSSHFLDMPEMNVRWLYDHLCGVHGGLMCSAIAAMADRLDLCLTEVVLKMEDVDDLLKPSNVEGHEGGSALRQQTIRLRQGRKVEQLYTLLPEILSVIDNAWQEGIQKPAADAVGCMVDDEYALAFEQYVSDATLALLTHLQDPEVRNQVDASLHSVMDSIAPKFKLVCCDFTNSTYGLPVLTRSPLVALALHFKRIPVTLKEIARWFDPMVDYIVAFSKSWYSPSPTQAAVDAVRQYDCLMKDCPADALLLSVILNNYAASLYLEVALPSCLASHTQRIQTLKELSLLFRSGADKNSGQDQATDDGTKKLRARRTKQSSTQEVETKAQLASLQAQCDLLSKAMNMACKPKDTVPLKHKSNHAIQGVNLLVHSSWNWQGISSSSRSRDFHNIAGAAVLEFNIIAEYREELIQSVPAASSLRSSLAAQFQRYMKRPSAFFARRDGPPVAPPQFSFADQISHPPTDETFAISDALPSWVCYQDKHSDREMIQKVVYAVEKCPLAWKDPFAVESKSPELNQGVQAALQGLVRELEINAYHKRSGDLDTDSDAEEAETTLGILFRGCEAKTFLPKGKKALGPLMQKNLLPKVSSKALVAPQAQEDFGELEAMEDPALSPTQEHHSSPTPIPESENFENPYPPAQRPASSTGLSVSPTARSSRRRSSAASVSEAIDSGSTQIVSPKSTRKRTRISDDIGRGGNKKRTKGPIRFAQS